MHTDSHKQHVKTSISYQSNSFGKWPNQIGLEESLMVLYHRADSITQLHQDNTQLDSPQNLRKKVVKDFYLNQEFKFNYVITYAPSPLFLVTWNEH